MHQARTIWLHRAINATTISEHGCHSSVGTHRSQRKSAHCNVLQECLAKLPKGLHHVGLSHAKGTLRQACTLCSGSFNQVDALADMWGPFARRWLCKKVKPLLTTLLHGNTLVCATD